MIFHSVYSCLTYAVVFGAIPQLIDRFLCKFQTPLPPTQF
jgi:hypothetical protein